MKKDYLQIAKNYATEKGEESYADTLRKNGLQKAKDYATTKKGYCLSTEYKNIYSKLEWKCHNELHPSWFAQASSVMRKNSWCKICHNETLVLKNGLVNAIEHAKKRKGLCLSQSYKNSSSMLIWQCQNKNHSPWKATYGNVVINGTWCPECGHNRNVQENRTRKILNLLFNTKFIKSNSKWNINPETNRILELDGYCDKLKIAFEYQGEQHFLTSKLNSKSKLDYIKRKDRYKIENCLNNGVKLIVINFIKNKNCLNNGVKLIVINFIKNKNCFDSFFVEIKRAILEAGLSIKNQYDETELKKIFYTSNGTTMQKTFLKKAQIYAHSKKGYCISKEYINATTKMEWKCHNEQHTSWFSSYHKVVNAKVWCPKCSAEKTGERCKNSDGLKIAKEHAIKKNGSCLSTEYINSHENLQWKCHNEKHLPWRANYNNVVLIGTWCPECAKNKKLDGLYLAQRYAQTRNGYCISQEYINSKTKLEWKCENANHPTWLSAYDKAVRRNQWCKQCHLENKKSKK